MLASLGDEVNRVAATAASRLCAGQLRELENAFNLDLTESDHLDILSAKTATLFELPCALGAALSGVLPAAANACVTYASFLGLAFQLVDDTLDFAGDAAQLGKSTMTDVREGVYSFPVLHALRHPTEGPPLRGLLRQSPLSDDDVHAVVAAARNAGGVSAGLARATALAHSAIEALAGVPPGPASESLEALATFAVSRSD